MDSPNRPALAGLLLAALTLLTALGVAGVLHLGGDLRPPGGLGGVHGGGGHTDTLRAVLLALAVVTVVARGLGVLLQRVLGQPAVIGEIIAGLVLGPSVLGALAPSWQQAILPDEAAPSVGLIAKVGVVLFMFLLGLELDPRVLRDSGRTALQVAIPSILLPFLLGTGLSLWLYPRYAGGVSFTLFTLFIGVCTSVTAFPVLARILSERRLQATRLGVLALSAAAINDVVAWTLLLLLVGLAQARLSEALWTLPALGLYLAGLVWIARPAMAWLAAREERETGPLRHGVLAVVFVSLLGSAWITELLGVHALFGAFLLGVVMPHEGRLASHLHRSMEDVVLVLFLPAFFAFTGMRTQVGLVTDAQGVLATGAIIAVASAGKLLGTALAARASGLGWRPASALGVLMNTRGLMELVVLNVGLDLGVITPALFTMFVIMALVTTFATSPLLGWILPARAFADDPTRP